MSLFFNFLNINKKDILKGVFIATASAAFVATLFLLQA